MFSNKEEFLNVNAKDYSAREIALNSGRIVLLSPLRPSLRAETLRMNGFEKLLAVLSNGLTGPRMNRPELCAFIDNNPMEAVEVYNRIQSLSRELDNIGRKTGNSDSEFLRTLEAIAKIRGERK